MSLFHFHADLWHLTKTPGVCSRPNIPLGDMKMTNRRSLNSAMLAAAVATIASTVALTPVAEAAQERCYGVSKAGKNSCASSVAGTTCAGTSTVDYDTKAWKYVAKGTCTSLNAPKMPGGKGKLNAV
jgi:uncharacterized membrane protein